MLYSNLHHIKEPLPYEAHILGPLEGRRTNCEPTVNRLHLTCLGVLTLALSACGPTTPTPPTPPADPCAFLGDKALIKPMATTYTPVGKMLADYQKCLGNDVKSVLVLHYTRLDSNYDKWNVWSWDPSPGGKDGAHAFTGSSSFGKIAYIAYKADPGKRGFIIRKGEWEAKDPDANRFVTLPASGVGEVWATSGQEAFYTTLPNLPQQVFVDKLEEIKVGFTSAPSGLQADQFAVKVGGVIRAVSSVTGGGLSATLRLSSLLTAAEVSAPITVSYNGGTALSAVVRDALNSSEFFYAGNDLGATHTPGGTTFKVWSPVASSAKVLLYDSATQPQPSKTLTLTRGDKGVWSGLEAGNQNGKFYRLELVSYGLTRQTVDPYAHAAVHYAEDQDLNLLRGMIVDLSSTDPAGFDTYTQPQLAKRTDASVYEVHVRDFTVSESSGASSANRGKYLGMVEAGIKVPGTTIASGLDHLKNLGVNTVQLLPAYDFGNETADAYNWGYDPLLYNVPEGQYSTNRVDPARAIRDFKTMVKGLNDAGLNVVMDVVYNHTKHTGERSPFDQVVPGYYYRTNDDGSYRNDTGVGNVIATERPMVRKFILDSLKYWVNEYRIQGFRFDLMGTFDPDTVRAISTELTALKPNILMYGEPWTGGGPTLSGKGSTKGQNMGVFNDDFRNGIIGGVFNLDRLGFHQGEGGQVNPVKTGLAGSLDTPIPGASANFTQEPGESTNYATSHDNYVLWDRIEKGANKAVPLELKKSMMRLPAAVVFTAQGLPFFVGGEEFARSKNGNENSYNAGDVDNAFDWTRLKPDQFGDVSAYYAGIIKLRAAHPAFRLDKATDVRSVMSFITDLDASKNLIGFNLDGSKVAGETWKTIRVYFNGSLTQDQSVTLPAGIWKVVVKDNRAGTADLETASGSVTLPKLSSLIVYQN